jgi:hypothetical protein
MSPDLRANWIIGGLRVSQQGSTMGNVKGSSNRGADEVGEKSPRVPARYALDCTDEIDEMSLKNLSQLSPKDRALIADRLSRDVVRAARAGILASGRFTTDEQIRAELFRRLHGHAMDRAPGESAHS